MSGISSTGRRPQPLLELQEWYLESLVPKLIDAAAAGKVERSAVAALDSGMRALFDLPAAGYALRERHSDVMETAPSIR